MPITRSSLSISALPLDKMARETLKAVIMIKIKKPIAILSFSENLNFLEFFSLLEASTYFACCLGCSTFTVISSGTISFSDVFNLGII